jgi:TonB-linked SusC/RagA family outer membrane protein
MFRETLRSKLLPVALIVAAAGLFSTSANAQTGTVAGTVTDSEGQILPGVNVVVVETQLGAATDEQGEYSITGVQPGTYTVRASFIGYSDETRSDVQVQANQTTTVNFQLAPSAADLDEVVVVGYGETREVNLSGSVASVEGEELAQIPTARVDQAMQGRFTGVRVNQVSGEPGQDPKIRIRGSNSIQGSNEPLWVVDGAIVGRDFNLSNISSKDIESIEVLKDAVSLSIYGSRASNGVVLVTTKTGEQMEPGETHLSFSSKIGAQSKLEGAEYLNGPQHARYANEDARFRQATEPFDNPGSVPNTNWLEEVTKVAPTYNAHATVSGASESGEVNYYNSISYLNQQGVVKASGLKKVVFRSNLDWEISDVVSAGYKANISRLVNQNNVINTTQVNRDILPVRAIRNDEGLFTAENPVSATVRSNPVANITLQDNESTATNMLSTAFLRVEPSDNFVIETSFSPQINNSKMDIYNPGDLPENRIVNAGGNGSIEVVETTGILNENTISYSPDLGENHELDLLAGFTFQTLKSESVSSGAFEFSNDVVGYNNLSFGTNPSRNTSSSEYNEFNIVSWIQRTNYIFNDKYIFTFVGRVDGSSRFAPGNRYGFFPSGAFAWRIAEEPFIQNLNFFDQLKLRASLGTTGSQSIESFQTLPILEAGGTTFSGSEQSTVQTGRPANPGLQWELTNQFDVGLDAAILGGRVAFTANYFYKRTERLLLNVQIPRQTGFNSRLQNLGSLTNRGLEFSLRTTNVAAPNFEWTSTFNIFGIRNEVQDLGGVDFINVVNPSATGQGGPGARLIVGEPVPVFVGVEYLGTWKSQEQIDNSVQEGTNQDVGGPRFKDQDGNGVINTEDFVVLGRPQPTFSYGVGNTFNFRNWSVDFFLQGTVGNEVFNSLTQTAMFGRAERTKYKETLDRWTPDNRDSDIPRAGAVASLSEVPNNSAAIEDGTHLRLKSATVRYDVPVENIGLRGTTGVEELGLYFSGSNLLLFSGFRLADPETSQFAGSNVTSGFAAGEYPTSRTFTFGVNASF